MILMIDNYDSFTYNLVQYFGALKAQVKVFRNDALTIDRYPQDEASKNRHFSGAGSPGRCGHLDGYYQRIGA